MIRNISILLMLFAIFIAEANADQPFAVHKRRILPAEVVGRDVLGPDGKPLVPRKYPHDDATFQRLERHEQQAFTFLKTGQFKLSEEHFEKALALFDKIQRQTPRKYLRHLEDKAELLEGLAMVLSKQGRTKDSGTISAKAKIVRVESLKQPASRVRTYANGYSVGLPHQ